MKPKIIISAIALSLLTAPVTALEYDQDSLEEYRETVNQNSGEIPGFVKELVGDQDINIYIEREDSNSQNLSLRMEGTRIEEISNSSLDNPDIEVETSSEVVENISGSENPVDRLKEAMDNGKISYQTSSVLTKAKLFVAESLMGFM